MLAWFISPQGKNVRVEDALNKNALAQYYPLSYLRVCAQEREWSGKPSVTQLLRGTREAYLKIHCPYAIDPSKQAFRVLGSTSHITLESMADSPHAEQREEDSVSTGVWDMIEKVGDENWLIDYKTSGAFTVSRFLGLKKKDVPMKDSNGNPVRYTRNGKNYKKGDIRYEKKFIIGQEKDNFEWTYQLNRYRILAEQSGIKIHRLKIFCIIRDAGTWKAENWGIKRNTVYLDVDILPDNIVMEYFTKKSEQLISRDKSPEEMLLRISRKEHPIKLILNDAPPVCSSQETWNGKKCKDYCVVKSYCQEIGDNPWLKKE